MSTINERAMLVSQHIACYHPTRISPKAAHAAEASCNTERGAIKASISLFDEKSVPSYRTVIAAHSALRNTYYAQTLPWLDDGARVMTTANYEQFGRLMIGLTRAFDNAADAFEADYPALYKDGPQRLNGLWNPADHPTPDAIRGRFGVKYDFMPFPCQSDFRVNLSVSETDVLKQRLEETVRNVTHSAQAEVWDRLVEALGKMSTTLHDADRNRFHETLFGNLGELADLLPRLDLAGDGKVADVCRELKAGILQQTSASVKNDATARAQTAKQVDAMLAKVAALRR